MALPYLRILHHLAGISILRHRYTQLYQGLIRPSDKDVKRHHLRGLCGRKDRAQEGQPFAVVIRSSFLD